MKGRKDVYVDSAHNTNQSKLSSYTRRLSVCVRFVLRFVHCPV